MTTGSRQRIFPLHLTPIEKFLLADDRPKYPMAFVIDMALSGTLDRDAFDVALRESLARHPLLKSLIRPAKQNALCWVSASGQYPYVDWAEADAPITFPNHDEWINLHDETGLRIWIRQGTEQVRLTAQFHHVCCDGIGAYRFLGDLLAIYGARTASEGARPTMDEVSPVRLRGRADGCGYLDRSGQASLQRREAIKLLFQLAGRGCDPLYPSKPRQRTVEFPGYRCHSFNQDEFKQLRNAAKAFGSLLNDLLLLELFYTMHDWNASNRKRITRRKYRIMMPTDLRGTKDYETPAANIIGYSFLTHKASDLRDKHDLANKIREETALIKHERLGARFVDMVSTAAAVRGLLPFATAMPRTLSSAILTNVGDPSRRFLARFPRESGRLVCGNLILERISGFPPIRPKTRAAFSIVSYRKELTIGLRCDPHLFSLGDTEQMLGLYADRLRAYL
ncbi:MAG: hypothetical protein ACQESR_23695 [Planctomycetota bacterium]